MSISESAAPVCADQARLLKVWTLGEYHPQRAIKEVTWIGDTLKKRDCLDLQEFAETAIDIMGDEGRAVKDLQPAVKGAPEALDRHTAEQRC